MSQELILNLLKNLGGQVTQEQLEMVAKPHYAGYTPVTLKKQVNHKLMLLRKWGLVTKDEKRAVWLVRETPG